MPLIQRIQNLDRRKEQFLVNQQKLLLSFLKGALDGVDRLRDRFFLNRNCAYKMGQKNAIIGSLNLSHYIRLTDSLLPVLFNGLDLNNSAICF